MYPAFPLWAFQQLIARDQKAEADGDDALGRIRLRSHWSPVLFLNLVPCLESYALAQFSPSIAVIASGGETCHLAAIMKWAWRIVIFHSPFIYPAAH